MLPTSPIASKILAMEKVTSMSKSSIDTKFQSEIMTPEEVALYLRKSLSWVYKNVQILGGKKLGGSIFFPAKEDLYERLFCKSEGVAIRLHHEGDQVYGDLVQNKNSSKTSRSKKKGEDKKPKTGTEDPNRYGLLDIGK